VTDHTTQPDELVGASWIGRLVPASSYTVAQTGHDREDIVPEGESLGQWVTIDAEASSLMVDLGVDPGRGEQRFDLKVAREPGGVALASKRLTGSTFKGFVHWMAFDPPLPSGTYVVEIRDAVGGVA
jgi:hypothetical protein